MGYLGSKGGSGVYQLIVAAMPRHDTYIETHLGSGVVLERKPPALRSIVIDRDPDVIASARRRFASYPGIEFVTGDCVDYLKRFDWSRAGRVLVFNDPPYPWATRTSAKRYRHEYSDDDHRRLIAALRALPRGVAVMVTSYPSALYDALLGDWRAVEYQSMTRRGVRTEKLWLNFPAGTAPHWIAFAGANYRERWRISKKARRWAEQFAAMPEPERLAVLAALVEVLGAGALPRAAPGATSSAAIAASADSAGRGGWRSL